VHGPVGVVMDGPTVGLDPREVGLGLIQVGDLHELQVVQAFDLGKLVRDRLEFRSDRLERVLGLKHVEIACRSVGQQPGKFVEVLGLCLTLGEICLLARRERLPVEQDLGQPQVVAFAVEDLQAIGPEERIRAAAAVFGDARRSVDLRQQAAEGDALACREHIARFLGDSQARAVVDGGAEKIRQSLSRCRRLRSLGGRCRGDDGQQPASDSSHDDTR